MKSVASATIIVMALLVTTTNGSLLRDSKGKLLLKAKATTKATAKATTKAQGVHVRGHTGATVVDTWTANTAAWNDRIYRVTDFGRFTTSNYQYFVKTSVTRRGHSIPLESTFAARYVVITETAMHSSITNSHACPSSWKTAEGHGPPGFVKHDLYGHSSGFATFGTYCSYVDVLAGSEIIVPAGGEKKFIFVKHLNFFARCGEITDGGGVFASCGVTTTGVRRVYDSTKAAVALYARAHQTHGETTRRNDARCCRDRRCLRNAGVGRVVSAQEVDRGSTAVGRNVGCTNPCRSGLGCDAGEARCSQFTEPYVPRAINHGHIQLATASWDQNGRSFTEGGPAGRLEEPVVHNWRACPMASGTNSFLCGVVDAGWGNTQHECAGSNRGATLCSATARQVTRWTPFGEYTYTAYTAGCCEGWVQCLDWE